MRFPSELFTRYDESDDTLFYAFPRKVVHIDDGAIAALTERFAALLPARGVILDLMSSWRSHLPGSLQPARVVGLGMNAEEMADNPQLDKFVVHDLNREPRLPFDDAVFDAAVCTVSVQYLTRPLQVFADVRRVLRPGGVFIVAFSNRCFPSKAVAAWSAGSDAQRMALVTTYFEASGGWHEITAWQRPVRWLFPAGGDPLYVVHASREPEAE
jgi:SAM-dependent methyltransferase